jgi:hypothetical protein
MPDVVEARFYVAGYERFSHDPDSTQVKLQAVTRGEHNKNWAKYTPSGSIQMTIKNESAADWFVGQLGKEIAVRFSPAPADGLCFAHELLGRRHGGR